LQTKKNLISISGPKYAITESLTKRRIKLLEEAKNVFGFNKVWTFKGKVFCYAGSEKHEITTFDDIHRLSFMI